MTTSGPRILRPALAFVLAVTLLAAGARAQGFSRAYDTGTSWDDMAWAGPAPGGGLVVLGSTDVVAGRFGDAMVLRLDDDGAIVSATAYGTPEREDVAGAAPTSDGGALLCGATTLQFDFRTGFLARVDRDGSLAWSKTLLAPTATQVTTAFAVTELGDGGVAVTGNYSEIDTPPRPAFVMVFEADGRLRWQRFFGSGDLEQPQAIAQASDGALLVAGLTAQASGAGDNDAWVARLSPAGDLLWARSYGGAFADEWAAVAATPEGGAFVAGMTASFTSSGRAPWVMRLAPDGAVQWHRVIGDAEWGDAHGVLARPGGGCVAVGRIALPGAPSNDLWLAALDASGAVAWQRLYDAGQGDWGACVSKSADGLGLVAGAMSAWGFAEQDHWILRTDAEGRLACAQSADPALAAGEPAIAQPAPLAAIEPITFTFPDAPFAGADVAVTSLLRCDACMAAGGLAPGEPSTPRAGWLPLLVTRTPAPRVTVELPAAASALNLYVDRVGSWYAPSLATGTRCRVTAWTDNGDGTVTIDADLPAGSWLAVAASNACGESSAGRDSLGVERMAVGTWEACPLGP